MNPLIFHSLLLLATLAAWALGLDVSFPIAFSMATLQYSVPVRNARLDAIETTIGTGPEIEFWSGSLPATCATAASGTLLARGNLPSDWLAAAASGQIAKTGTWTFNGVASGTIGYFRINRTGSPTACDIQGDVTATGGGGAMTVDNTSIANAQVVTVTSFTITAGNA